MKRLQFRASLHHAGKQVSGLEVIIDCDQSGGEDPLGFVLGNNDTYETLESLDPKRRLPADASLTSETGSFLLGEHDQVTATVDFKRLSRRGSGEGPTAIIGQFACRNLTYIRCFEREHDADSRRLYFFMAGPHHHWAYHHSTERSYTGDVTIKVKDTELTIDQPLPFSFEVRPHYLHADQPQRDHQLTCNVTSVAAHTDQIRADLPDEHFIAQATAVVDDMCLLVSFLSGGRVDWYSYTLASNDRRVDHYKTLWRRSRRDTDMQDTSVPVYESREFLRTAVPRIASLRAEGTDLRLPLLYVTSATEVDTLEQRFLALFLALEHLKDSFARENQRDLILGGSVFRKLKRRIRQQLEQIAAEPNTGLTIGAEELDLLVRKLPDLNRPSFWDLLQELLTRYDVEWRDLYPPTAELSRPRFIGLRDALVHSGSAPSIEALWFETTRLHGLVERLILKMLGRTDTFSSPRPWYHTILRSKLGG